MRVDADAASATQRGRRELAVADRRAPCPLGPDGVALLAGLPVHHLDAVGAPLLAAVLLPRLEAGRLQELPLAVVEVHAQGGQVLLVDPEDLLGVAALLAARLALDDLGVARADLLVAHVVVLELLDPEEVDEVLERELAAHERARLAARADALDALDRR